MASYTQLYNIADAARDGGTVQRVPGTDSVIVTGIPQRSAAWHQIRAGRLTASNVAAALGRSQFESALSIALNIVGAKRILEDAQLALHGKDESEAVSEKPSVRYGVRYESRARQIFEAVLGVRVAEVSFCYREHSPQLGASPDGLVPRCSVLEICADRSQQRLTSYSESCLEIKCIFAGRIPLKPFESHLLQLLTQMHCTSRTSVGWLMYWRQDRVRVWRVHWSERIWQTIFRYVQAFLHRCTAVKTALRSCNLFEPLLNDSALDSYMERCEKAAGAGAWPALPMGTLSTLEYELVVDSARGDFDGDVPEEHWPSADAAIDVLSLAAHSLIAPFCIE